MDSVQGWRVAQGRAEVDATEGGPVQEQEAQAHDFHLEGYRPTPSTQDQDVRVRGESRRIGEGNGHSRGGHHRDRQRREDLSSRPTRLDPPRRAEGAQLLVDPHPSWAIRCGRQQPQPLTQRVLELDARRSANALLRQLRRRVRVRSEGRNRQSTHRRRRDDGLRNEAPLRERLGRTVSQRQVPKPEASRHALGGCWRPPL